MNRQELREALLSTAQDGKLSRAERQALRQVIADREMGDSERRALQGELFAAVVEQLSGEPERALVEWLSDILPLLAIAEKSAAGPRSHRCYFGPEDPMVETVEGLIRGIRGSLDVAMFTVTDDRIAHALLDVHKRGCQLRMIVDDDKAGDRGSDVARLAAAGIPLLVDRSPHHFHHKFAVFDGRTLLNGSYNWTRSADRNNRENFLVTDEPGLVQPYVDAFDEMWRELI